MRLSKQPIQRRCEEYWWDEFPDAGQSGFRERSHGASAVARPSSAEKRQRVYIASEYEEDGNGGGAAHRYPQPGDVVAFAGIRMHSILIPCFMDVVGNYDEG